MVSEKTDTPGLSIGILAITRHGASLALEIQKELPGSICYVPVRHNFAIAQGAVGFAKLATVISEVWLKHAGLVCIMATGIVVRHLAPLFRHKTLDPAVVVLDEKGQFIVSLLSGHLGGANRLAQKIAQITGGQAVITTASDVRGKPAIDLIARDAGLDVENPKMIARVSLAFLEEETVWIFDPRERLATYLQNQGGVVWISGFDKNGEPSRLISDEYTESNFRKSTGWSVDSGVGIWVSEFLPPANLHCLNLRPRNLVVGLGCNRDTSTSEMMTLIRRVFDDQNLSPLSIRNLASIDLKANEQAILESGLMLDRPVDFYSRADLKGISVPNPSNLVMIHVGVPSVCEATALLSARNGELIIPKRKTANVTMAVVRVN